jgi:histidyl-tRNA synthetase
MRYDQTVPLARVISQYANDIPLPFKRYQIQNVYRAENTQRGRYREFLQVDVDTIGSPSLTADVEIATLVLEAYKKLNLKNIVLEINDRSNFEGLDPKFVTSLDKLKKIGQEGVISELIEKGMGAQSARSLIDKMLFSQAPERLHTIFQRLESQGFKKGTDFIYAPTLVRGLDYYTGPIFELYSRDYESALGGGGRYDKLIGLFAEQQVSAVGFSFGFDRIIEAMLMLGAFPDDLGGTEILVANISEDSQLIASKIRAQGINTELYIDEKELDKQLKYADKKRIPFVLIAQGDKLNLKNMKTGEQKEVNIENLSNAIR